jgi:predicted aspartyl protease
LEARRCVSNAYSDRTVELKRLAQSAGAVVDSTAMVQQSSISSPQTTASPPDKSKLSTIEVPTVATKYDEIQVQGSINGRPVTFEVDSGASHISIPAAIAEKIQHKEK